MKVKPVPPANERRKDRGTLAPIILASIGVVVLIWFFAAIAHSAEPVRPPEPPGYHAAYSAAYYHQRPLLVFVHADWCIPCKRILSIVRPLGIVEVNIDRHAAWCERWGWTQPLPKLYVYTRGQDGRWSTQVHVGADQIKVYVDANTPKGNGGSGGSGGSGGKDRKGK
jgi:hypothetical protein